MDQELKDRLLTFVRSVYDMEPLSDDLEETPLGEEALELMDMLAKAGAKDTEPLRCNDCEDLEDNCEECKNG